MASWFAIHSQPDAGTIVVAGRWRTGTAEAPSGPFRIGAFVRPMHGETACGDAWAAAVWPEGAAFLLADGLGHGVEAAKAADAVVETFVADPMVAPDRVLDRAGTRARATRGAAALVAAIDSGAGVLRYCGAGNVAGYVHDKGSTFGLSSQPGIVGGPVGRLLVQELPFRVGALLVLGTDGVHANRWLPARHPGIVSGDLRLAAATLVRDLSRGRDDAAALVARQVA
jgi:hypothetical protein